VIVGNNKLLCIVKYSGESHDGKFQWKIVVGKAVKSR